MPHISQTCQKIDPRRLQNRSQRSPKLLLGASCGPHGPSLGPTWANLGQLSANLGPTWPILAPTWPQLGPSWPQLRPNLAPSWPIWAENGGQEKETVNVNAGNSSVVKELLTDLLHKVGEEDSAEESETPVRLRAKSRASSQEPSSSKALMSRQSSCEAFTRKCATP